MTAPGPTFSSEKVVNQSQYRSCRETAPPGSFISTYRFCIEYYIHFIKFMYAFYPIYNQNDIKFLKTMRNCSRSPQTGTFPPIFATAHRAMTAARSRGYEYGTRCYSVTKTGGHCRRLGRDTSWGRAPTAHRPGDGARTSNTFCCSAPCTR